MLVPADVQFLPVLAGFFSDAALGTSFRSSCRQLLNSKLKQLRGYDHRNFIF